METNDSPGQPLTGMYSEELFTFEEQTAAHLFYFLSNGQCLLIKLIRVLVHNANACARNDVMKLVQQHLLPRQNQLSLMPGMHNRSLKDVRRIQKVSRVTHNSCFSSIQDKGPIKPQEHIIIGFQLCMSFNFYVLSGKFPQVHYKSVWFGVSSPLCISLTHHTQATL